MESWENIVLQWINCLCSSNNRIKSLEDLQDGKIYYNLINRVIPWSSKETNENERNMVMQFLGEEYPNFAFRNRNSTISNLCTASLILSRLSLEPVFHKSLCMNLDVDAQVTIKSILESVYSLGKSITAEDLCEIFSLSTKKDFKSLAIKPKFILEEFLKSPAARTIQNDKKQFEQSKQIRQLKAEIETMKYEKSELVEDMKSQERQIRDLQNKLQEALTELKSIKSSKRNSCNFSVEGREEGSGGRKGLEIAYQKELESLEKYVNELQTDNYQLEDEKKTLSDEVKMYKEKYQFIKEKNDNNEQAIESMLIQIEKKEDELMEMKMRYDELLNHMKERTKTFMHNQSIINQSFESDERILAEISWNKSEALSSVIEIQLEEVRKDYNNLQKEYKSVNFLLNVFMEEYKKLKSRNENLIFSNRQTKAKLREEYMTDAIIKIQNDLIKNDHAIKEKIINDISCAVLLSKESDSLKNTKNVIDKYERMVKIKHYSEKPTLIKFNVLIQQQTANESKKTMFIFKVLLQEIVTGLIGVTSKNDVLEKLLFKITRNSTLTNSAEDYLSLINFVKHNFEVNRKCVKAIEDNNNVSSKAIMSPCDWNTVHSTWTSLSESLENDIKIHKVLLLLEQSWLFVSALLRDVTNCNSSIQSGFEQLLQKKDKIESELKKIRFENSQILSFNLIAAVKFITILTSYCNIGNENDVKENLSNIGELNVQERKALATKIINVKRMIDDFNYSLNLYKEEMANFVLRNTVQDNVTENSTKENKISNNQSDDNNINNVCTETAEKEIRKEEDCFEDIETIEKEKTEEVVNSQINKNECKKVEIDCIKKEIPEEQNETVNGERICIELVKKEITEETNNVNSITKTNKEVVSVESTKPEIAEESELPQPLEKKTECIKNESNEIVDDIPAKSTEHITSQRSKSSSKEELKNAGDDSSSHMTPQQVEKYVREIHEKYELKLDKMKEKMKSAFNSQVSSLRREQEQSFKSRLDALQAKLEQQCYSHSEELRKYKKHISELTTQLWDVGEKLIIEKQKKEEFVHRMKELHSRHESSVSQQQPPAPRPSLKDKENWSGAAQQPAEPMSKMQSVRGFQIMGNAFRSEDEEGELFDTTYLTDVQRQRSNPEVDRLSILQLRNAKCKPHLKSSYPAEMQFYPPTLTEDEIKTGSAQDETFNDSLSQSLLTGKKVKRKDRTRTGAETPRSRRRFSNIFRKPRLSIDPK